MIHEPNPGSIVATSLAGAALTVAVAGGGAAVAGGYAKDSIASRHIKVGAVRSVDVVDNTVTGAKVADSAVEAATAQAAHRVLGMSRAMMRPDGSLIAQEGGSIIDSEQTETPGATSSRSSVRTRVAW